MNGSHSLKELYLIEHETHLATMTADYFALRSEGVSRERVNSMARAAHSLKGAARLVHEAAVEEASHQLEEYLKGLVSSETMTDSVAAAVHRLLVTLGAKNHQLEFSPADGRLEVADEGLLHLNQKHIDEIVHLAGEVAVLSRRIESALSRGRSAKADELEQLMNDSQAAVALTSVLERTCTRLRLVPLHEVARGLVAMSDTLGRQIGKEVRVRVINGGTLIDRELLRRTEPVLIQLLRNALDHGIEPREIRRAAGKQEEGTISLVARKLGATVEISFRDDGGGVDIERIRARVVERGLHSPVSALELRDEELLEFLFLPGFSTLNQVSELSGRGLGLDIVRDTIRGLGGSVTVSSELGGGTEFSLRVPSRLAMFRALILEVGGSRIGVALPYVEKVVRDCDAVREHIGAYTVVRMHGQEVPLVDGRRFFELSSPTGPVKDEGMVVFMSLRGALVGVVVDSVLGEHEVVVHPLDERYRGIKSVLGVCDSGSGRLITIVNPEEISLSNLETESRASTSSDDADGLSMDSAKRILVVDDSMTVRELERRLLLQAGYHVETAVDGVEGLEKMSTSRYDLVITDLDMPRLSGFELIGEARAGIDVEVPILIVSYKEREDDRTRGLALGANGYVSKGSFKDDTFLKMVRSLLGESTARERSAA